MGARPSPQSPASIRTTTSSVLGLPWIVMTSVLCRSRSVENRPGMPSTWSKWPCVSKSRSSLLKPAPLRSNWRCVPSPQSTMMRWPPASTRRPGWLRSAEGTLAEVPRKVRSNMIECMYYPLVGQAAMARACKRTISRANVTSRARRTCALRRLPGSRPRPRSDTSDVSLLRSARRDGSASRARSDAGGSLSVRNPKPQAIDRRKPFVPSGSSVARQRYRTKPRGRFPERSHGVRSAAAIPSRRYCCG